MTPRNCVAQVPCVCSGSLSVQVALLKLFYHAALRDAGVFSECRHLYRAYLFELATLSMQRKSVQFVVGVRLLLIRARSFVSGFIYNGSVSYRL